MHQRGAGVWRQNSGGVQEAEKELSPPNLYKMVCLLSFFVTYLLYTGKLSGVGNYAPIQRIPIGQVFEANNSLLQIPEKCITIK